MARTWGVAVTVFGCGWVLMGLEIVGGRMLSPDFGSGVWTWGSIISVFLAALSTGYFVGGLLSQRSPRGLGLRTSRPSDRKRGPYSPYRPWAVVSVVCLRRSISSSGWASGEFCFFR